MPAERKFCGHFCVYQMRMKLSLAVFDRMCYNKMNYVDNTVGVYALCVRLLPVE